MAGEGGKVETRIVVRPIGSALPLGFFAFGIGMFLLAADGLGWSHPAEAKDVGLILVSFVAPLEFIAATVAFLARDTVGATLLGLFAGSWLLTGSLLRSATPGSPSHALGVFVLAFGVVILLLAAIAAASKPFFTVVLSGSALRMFLFGAWQLGAGHAVLTAAGWTSVVLGVLAFYGGAALALEDVRQETVLPLFRRGAAREALEGSLDQQLAGLPNEPGVRHQL
jgi:succinate-acetate transporter protein